MMIKVYHLPPSTDAFGGSRNATKILIALDEIGEEYSIVPLTRDDDCRPPQGPYRKLNPNGVTPTIDDDGFILWESSAILRYLADSRGDPTLLASSIKDRALAQQWLGWEGTTLMPALLALFFAMMAPASDKDVIEAKRAAFLGVLSILDNQLSGRDYVVDEFSIADIALGCSVPVAFNCGVNIAPFANIRAWLERLLARPAWAKAETFVADMAAGQEK